MSATAGEKAARREAAARRQEPLVSVVIPAYNCEDYVAEAIDSVLAQTYGNFEIIVVNDASTDGTAAVLGRYEREEGIRVMTHGHNKGLAAARNTGIRAARGEWITFLDADDVWRPEKIQYHLDILRRHPDLVFISNDGMRFRDGEVPRFPPLPKSPRLRRVGWKELLLGRGPFSGSNATVKRECLEEVGLFDERLRAAEDRDMWIRIARRYGAFQAPGAVHGYRMHGANMSFDPVHMEKNVARMLDGACERMRCSRWLRARARAHMYVDLAMVCYEAGQRAAAAVNLAKSVVSWPLPLGREVYRVPLMRWVWAVKVLLGKSLFERLWPLVRPGRRAVPGKAGAAPAT